MPIIISQTSSSIMFIANLDWISGECRWTQKEKGEGGFEMCLICMPSYTHIHLSKCLWRMLIFQKPWEIDKNSQRTNCQAYVQGYCTVSGWGGRQTNYSCNLIKNIILQALILFIWTLLIWFFLLYYNSNLKNICILIKLYY